MSRVGKLPIPIPDKVNVKIDGKRVEVKGPLGALHHEIPDQIQVDQDGSTLVVKRASDDRFQRSLHGLTRTLISNMVEGVSKGFGKNLLIEGVGYRALVKGNMLVLNLGYSHPVEYTVPDGITCKVERNKISLTGVDKQQVGQIAAIIRGFRKVEPYKGKGIRYENEVVRRKVGKVGT